MAKKVKTESVLSRETRLKAEADALATAGKAAEAAKAATAKAATPPAPAVRPKKVKKARYVREKKEKQVPVKTAELPARSTTAAGKMMSKNIAANPEDEGGGLPRGREASLPHSRRRGLSG